MEIKVFDEHGCAVQFATDPGSSFVEVHAAANTSAGGVATVFLLHDQANELASGCAAQHLGQLEDEFVVYGSAGVVNFGDPGGTVTVHPGGQMVVDDQAGNVVTLHLAGELGTASHALAAGASQI